MPRCVPPLVAALGLMAALLPAAAQVPRQFPATALRGEIVVAQPPELLLNGRPARLAPGARIRGEDNLMRVSGSLSNLRLVVHYTFDREGQLGEIWILTPAERAREPWPATAAEAARWSFDPLAQTWKRP